MCGCSGRSGGSLSGPGWPWKVTREDGSVDHYQDQGQAEYFAKIVRGTVEWVGTGPDPRTKSAA